MTRQVEAHLLNPSRRSQRALGWVCLGLVIGLAVSLVLLAVTAGRARVPGGLTIAMIVSATVFGVLALIMPIGYFVTRGEANRIQQLIEGFAKGQYLVRWSYTPELWNRYRQVEMREAATGMRQLLWGMGIGWILTMGIFIGIAVHSWQSPHPREHFDRTVLTWILAGITVFMGIMIVAVWLTIRAKMARMNQGAQDSIVSKRGIFCDRQFVLWGTAAKKLEKIEVIQKEDLTMLELSIGMNHNLVKTRVPVPPGSEALAKKVAKVIMEDPTASQGGGLGVVQDVAQTLGTLR